MLWEDVAVRDKVRERERERVDRAERQRWGNAWIPSHVFAHTHSFVGDSGAQPRWESRPPIAHVGQSYLASFAYIGGPRIHSIV